MIPTEIPRRPKPQSKWEVGWTHLIEKSFSGLPLRLPLRFSAGTLDPGQWKPRQLAI